MVQAFKLINEFKHWQPRVAAPDIQSTAFTQQSNHSNSESNDDWEKKAKCHNCSKKGHICLDCPKLKQEEDDNDNNDDVSVDDKKSSTAKSKKKKAGGSKKKVSLAQKADQDDESDDDDDTDNYDFCNVSNKTMDPIVLWDSILLNNQSTINLFCNRRLVS